MATYPLIPKTTAHLRPGQFWSIPMADGRFGCGRVLRTETGRASGGRTRFIAAILDWVGDSPPSSDAIAGSPVLKVGNAHVRLVSFGGGAILGERPLALDGIEPPATVDTYWGDGYAVARAEQRFIAGDPQPTSDFRQVSSPLTDEMLRPAPTGRGVVQFDRRLTDDDFRQLGEWFRAYPEMDLRAYGSYDHSITDLEFLRFFPTLRRFAADALWDSLTSLDGLRHLPTDLEELGIGATKAKLDLAVLSRFPELRWLFLEGQTKHLEAISGLTQLYDLTLRSITMPDLSLLLPLNGLRSLDLKLGGTRDLRLLPRIGELWYLELWMIRGLTDVTAVGKISSLRVLFLQALRQVEALPDFREASSLRRVRLETMKGLRDLRPLATAPALESVELIDMRPPAAGGPVTAGRPAESQGRHAGPREPPQERGRDGVARSPSRAIARRLEQAGLVGLTTIR
jgi:hypothetical protein